MIYNDYRDYPVKKETFKTTIITKEDIESNIYELIKNDMIKERKSYGKDYVGKVEKHIVRLKHYWVVSNSSDPDDLTIEIYVTNKKGQFVCQK